MYDVRVAYWTSFNMVEPLMWKVFFPQKGDIRHALIVWKSSVTFRSCETLLLRRDVFYFIPIKSLSYSRLDSNPDSVKVVPPNAECFLLDSNFSFPPWTPADNKSTTAVGAEAIDALIGPAAVSLSSTTVFVLSKVYFWPVLVSGQTHADRYFISQWEICCFKCPGSELYWLFLKTTPNFRVWWLGSK